MKKVWKDKFDKYNLEYNYYHRGVTEKRSPRRSPYRKDQNRYLRMMLVCKLNIISYHFELGHPTEEKPLSKHYLYLHNKSLNMTNDYFKKIFSKISVKFTHCACTN